MAALGAQKQRGGRIEDHLLAQGMVDAAPLAASLARFWGVHAVDPLAEPPDPRLIARLGAPACLRDRLLPLCHAGGLVVIATERPEEFDSHRPRLTAIFGPVAMAVAPAGRVEAALLAAFGPALARAAETSVPAPLSCRGWSPQRFHLPLALLGAAALGCGLLWPGAVLLLLTLWAVLALCAATLLKLAVGLAALRPPVPAGPPPRIARLPMVSVIVALHREADIARRLVRRLSRLTYPHDRLEILLVVEEEDRLTCDALARADLPVWMRVVRAPEGAVKTKPRALNHALGLCRGSIVGVYDAEDAPDPDQISRVVQRFHERGPRVVCLQGVLDFYNPRKNWLARCFTLEYATWFRLILPGLDRLGLPLPLGGTTLFFRREALDALGAWDAWNVTEDADLGMRLARRGWRTELIDTVTREEANCRPMAWVRQRSRWIKGYMMTWAVQMREPLALWRDLGPGGFLAFQALFLGSITQSLCAPVLWTWWLLTLGLGHPSAELLPAGALAMMIGLFILSELINLALGLAGLARAGAPFSRLWVPVMWVYFPLATLAAWKAAAELLVRPFHWEKTAHGHLSGA